MLTAQQQAPVAAPEFQILMERVQKINAELFDLTSSISAVADMLMPRNETQAIGDIKGADKNSGFVGIMQGELSYMESTIDRLRAAKSHFSRVVG